MTVTDYDMKPGVGITSSQPGPNTSASGVNGSFLPPPEGLRGSSVCSGPLRPHRQLSLQALGEREGKEEWPSLLPAGPPAWGGDLPAQVKPTDASWDPCWGIHAASCLFRFLSKRRLLLVSAPSEDDDSFQLQLSALAGQECPLGQSGPHTS